MTHISHDFSKGRFDVIQQMDKFLCPVKNYTFVPWFDTSTDRGQDNECYIVHTMQLEQYCIVFTSTCLCPIHWWACFSANYCIIISVMLYSFLPFFPCFLLLIVLAYCTDILLCNVCCNLLIYKIHPFPCYLSYRCMYVAIASKCVCHWRA
jgi:hypothetical protein